MFSDAGHLNALLLQLCMLLHFDLIRAQELRTAGCQSLNAMPRFLCCCCYCCCCCCWHALQELGTLLDVDPVKAEELAAEMIGEGRLSGSIDQVEGLIHFEDSLEQLVQWDRQVAATCVKVDNILEQVAAAHGAAVAAQ
jgi:hypothetical protein